MKTKIVFMGTPNFSVPILEGLVEQGYEVLAVVTQPDRFVGRKKILTAPPVKEAAVRMGLEVLQPEKISGSSEMERVLDLQPDLIITVAFGQFLPEKLLTAPKFGAINVHASLLPKYRGGAPVHYAIMKGEKETGVTIMRMIKKMDAGDILRQRRVPIQNHDDVGTMFEKLSQVGKDLLLEMLPDFLSGNITSIPQDEEHVSFSPNISREEEALDWEKNAQEIDWKVRGLRPWPIAFTMFEGIRWKIWEVEVSEVATSEKPGTIIDIGKDFLAVACGQGTVVNIKRLQPAGKAQLTANEFLNGVGKNIVIGDRLN